MRIVELHSHQNGHEHLLVHKPALLTEIENSIAAVDAGQCHIELPKRSKQKKVCCTVLLLFRKHLVVN